MIVYSTPYRTDKNIGAYYNDFMSRLNDGEWACFTDGDAMFTVPFFGTIMEEYIDKYPTMGLFTAKTNRVMNTPQLHSFRISEDFNMKHHFVIGEQRAKGNREITILNRNTPLSGVLMLISKETWKLHKFQEGCLGVDNEIHYSLIDAGREVAVMNDLYVFHGYRWKNYRDKSHLL